MSFLQGASVAVRSLHLAPRAGRLLTACFLLGGQVVGATGCEGKNSTQQEAEKAEPQKRPALYEAVELSEEQLSMRLKQACQQASARQQPVLVEFSAPWCKDCLRLQQMKKQPVLEQALASVELVTINVGDFDRHRPLIDAFAVKAIARWELLQPSDCSVEATHWKRLGGRTLEPETGQPVDAPALSAWLKSVVG